MSEIVFKTALDLYHEQLLTRNKQFVTKTRLGVIEQILFDLYNQNRILRKKLKVLEEKIDLLESWVIGPYK